MTFRDTDELDTQVFAAYGLAMSFAQLFETHLVSLVRAQANEDIPTEKRNSTSLI